MSETPHITDDERRSGEEARSGIDPRSGHDRRFPDDEAMFRAAEPQLVFIPPLHRAGTLGSAAEINRVNSATEVENARIAVVNARKIALGEVSPTLLRIYKTLEGMIHHQTIRVAQQREEALRCAQDRVPCEPIEVLEALPEL